MYLSFSNGDVLLEYGPQDSLCTSVGGQGSRVSVEAAANIVLQEDERFPGRFERGVRLQNFGDVGYHSVQGFVRMSLKLKR